MKRLGLLIALLALFTGVGLGAAGCAWTETETRRDFPPNALIPAHPEHGHLHE